jgi:hypothetical protein
MSARGGARQNAGRKSKSREILIERSRDIAVNAKITPLEYMLEVLQNIENPQKMRFEAAIAAAPYVHPRLTSATVTTTIKRSVDELTTAELIAALQQDADSPGAIAKEAGDGEPDSVH